MDALSDLVSDSIMELGTKKVVCDSHGEYSSTGRSIFGYESWTSCPECAAEAKASADRERAAERQRQAGRVRAARIERAGVPRRFHGATFDSFDADTEDQRAALDAVNDVVMGVRSDNGASAVLLGKPGTGKTHLAVAAVTELVDGFSSRYMTAMQLIRAVRDTWRRESEVSETEVISELVGLDLLVIDEIGVQYGTEGERTILFDVIDGRYRERRSTIMISNQSSDGLREYIGERAFDRLREIATVAVFDWSSHRGVSS